MHTILGAGGPIANALTRELISNNHRTRLVSRRPVNISAPNVDWQKADLLNYQQLKQATEGATIIYLCAGLVYDKDIWKQQWPVIMQNVINVAKHHQARLLFFDNVYMYGLVDGPMTEDTPYNPISVKGEVRAQIATTLMNEVKAGNLKASIARAADFYGAESLNSFYDSMVLLNYSKGKRAQWMGDPNKLHNFTYVPDGGRGMYILGQHPESDNQIWHLPTAPPLTGHQFIELAARTFDAPAKYMRINKLILRMAGMFNKVIQGTVEMYYQCDHNYNFNSSKFEKAFGVQPTSYQDGVKDLSQTLFKSGK
ncbi:NAD-dependent epimerase/dehydratase family protein [Mucilaginibacter sp. Bleaf8]|uniref:NAD-dependent epimerase/dehydratase family protein n=1 Tax=Mucilaginibacter sp. Bleaf8 TaxID=2834430 RepID=UPI001BCE6888|nr:NAD-dependent epimerase/dehydratase family protein [Mucilaginibacter sp. Bleaf8]MBS7565950.1 NAD-dependent epimerase/dehydratase family protein [Mucilaginibacter sp. Bleaf8]